MTYVILILVRTDGELFAWWLSRRPGLQLGDSPVLCGDRRRRAALRAGSLRAAEERRMQAAEIYPEAEHVLIVASKP